MNVVLEMKCIGQKDTYYACSKIINWPFEVLPEKGDYIIPLDWPLEYDNSECESQITGREFPYCYKEFCNDCGRVYLHLYFGDWKDNE